MVVQSRREEILFHVPTPRGRPPAFFDVHLKHFNPCSSEDPLSQSRASCLCNPSFPMKIGTNHNTSFLRIFFFTLITLSNKKYLCSFVPNSMYTVFSLCFFVFSLFFLQMYMQYLQFPNNLLIHANVSLEGYIFQCGQRKYSA